MKYLITLLSLLWVVQGKAQEMPYHVDDISDRTGISKGAHADNSVRYYGIRLKQPYSGGNSSRSSGMVVPLLILLILSTGLKREQ